MCEDVTSTADEQCADQLRAFLVLIERRFCNASYIGATFYHVNMESMVSTWEASVKRLPVSAIL